MQDVLEIRVYETPDFETRWVVIVGVKEVCNTNSLDEVMLVVKALMVAAVA